jgi:hypothetical protein
MSGVTNFTMTFTVTNLVLGDNPPVTSIPITMSWSKACGPAPGFYVFATPADQEETVVNGGVTTAGWTAPTSNAVSPGNPAYTFLPIGTDFFTFTFTQVCGEAAVVPRILRCWLVAVVAAAAAVACGVFVFERCC